MILDEDGNVTGWNEGALALKMYEAGEFMGLNHSEFYTHEAKVVGHPQRELAVAASMGKYEENGWRVRKDGSRFWAHVAIRAIYDDNGNLCGFGKVVRDLTDHKLAVEQNANIMKLLELTARTDYLTGVDNRRSFDQAMSAMISAARRHQRPLSLAVIDFDRFKDYNDKYGHQAGDAYLTQAAKLWRKSLRPEDFIARYGGEEFVVILSDTACEAGMVCIERLRAMLPAPLTCSAGVAEWDGVETPSALLGRAGRAVYAAKDAGRNCLIAAPNTPNTKGIKEKGGTLDAKALNLRPDSAILNTVHANGKIRGFREIH